MHILDLLEKIRATNKKSEKIALLSANKDLPFLKKIIYLAHSPRVKFYIKAIPTYECSEIPAFSNIDFALKSLENIQNNIEIKIYNYKNILYNLQKVLKK